MKVNAVYRIPSLLIKYTGLKKLMVHILGKMFFFRTVWLMPCSTNCVDIHANFFSLTGSGGGIRSHSSPFLAAVISYWWLFFFGPKPNCLNPTS